MFILSFCPSDPLLWMKPRSEQPYGEAHRGPQNCYSAKTAHHPWGTGCMPALYILWRNNSAPRLRGSPMGWGLRYCSKNLTDFPSNPLSSSLPFSRIVSQISNLPQALLWKGLRLRQCTPRTKAQRPACKNSSREAEHVGMKVIRQPELQIHAFV